MACCCEWLAEEVVCFSVADASYDWRFVCIIVLQSQINGTVATELVGRRVFILVWLVKILSKEVIGFVRADSNDWM